MEPRGKKLTLCSVTIFGNVSLLAVPECCGCKMLKGVHLLNAAVIQNRSCKRDPQFAAKFYTRS